MKRFIFFVLISTLALVTPAAADELNNDLPDDGNFDLPPEAKRANVQNSLQAAGLRAKFAAQQRRIVEVANKRAVRELRRLLWLGENAAVERTHLAAGRFTPGGLVVLRGAGFGDVPGRILARMETCEGEVTDLELEVAEWSDSVIGARVPKEVEAAEAQDVLIEVTTPTGLAAEFVGGFLPFMEMRTLHWTDPAISVLYCGPVAGFVSCNGSNNTTVEGALDSSMWGVKFAVVGQALVDLDAFDVELKNGWSFYSIVTDKTSNVSNPIPTFPIGLTDWSPLVGFTMPDESGATALHFSWIQIIGPFGVPH